MVESNPLHDLCRGYLVRLEPPPSILQEEICMCSGLLAWPIAPVVKLRGGLVGESLQRARIYYLSTL